MRTIFFLWENFHLADNSKQVYQIDKIKLFIEYMEKQWNKVFVAGQKIVIEETMVSFQG